LSSAIMVTLNLKIKFHSMEGSHHKEDSRGSVKGSCGSVTNACQHCRNIPKKIILETQLKRSRHIFQI
jgi:hypothetical protein